MFFRADYCPCHFDSKDSSSGGTIDAHGLATGYCCHLYQLYGTYEAVARRTGLDRRTVKKYIQEWQARSDHTDSIC